MTMEIKNKNGETVGWALDFKSSQREAARRAHNRVIFIRKLDEWERISREAGMPVMELPFEALVDPEESSG